MNIDIKNAEITALVDALFASKRPYGLVVADSVDAELGASLLKVLLRNPDARIEYPNQSRCLSGIVAPYVVHFMDATQFIADVDPRFISTVVDDDNGECTCTIWFGDGRKMVVELNEYTCKHAWVIFVKEEA